MTIATLVPVHGAELAPLRRCLAAVLAQRGLGAGDRGQVGVECLVLLSGDAAPDISAWLADLAAEDPRVTVFQERARLSASAARNALIDRAEARGHRWLAFCDDDDEWLPDHLAQAYAALSGSDTGPALYTAPYRQRQSGQVVRPEGLAPSLWSLTRQPLLLSSVVLVNRPAALRFRDLRAEDLVFYADALGQVRRFAAGDTPSVIYDQTNWARKSAFFKLRRTYGAYRAITGSVYGALGLTGLFAVCYLGRRLRARLAP